MGNANLCAGAKIAVHDLRRNNLSNPLQMWLIGRFATGRLAGCTAILASATRRTVLMSRLGHCPCDHNITVTRSLERF